VVFVHAKAQEEKFVADGFDVMYNDFMVIGPKADLPGIKGGKDVLAAFKTIDDKGSPFVSRGDTSGTHSAELALWKKAGLDSPAAKAVRSLIDLDLWNHNKCDLCLQACS
jgi:tungstate transport system substrate-binding protein